MNARGSSPARLLAPIALVAAFLAVIIVLSTSGGGGGSNGGDQGKKNQTTTTQGKKQKKKYIVKQGDSLSIIAQKTGVPVERLSQLNPNLDPQAIISGTCVALRSSTDCPQ